RDQHLHPDLRAGPEVLTDRPGCPFGFDPRSHRREANAGPCGIAPHTTLAPGFGNPRIVTFFAEASQSGLSGPWCMTLRPSMRTQGDRPHENDHRVIGARSRRDLWAWPNGRVRAKPAPPAT